MKKKIFKRVTLISVILFFGVIASWIAVLFITHDFNPHFLKIDSCLDAGGSWDYESNICEY